MPGSSVTLDALRSLRSLVDVHAYPVTQPMVKKTAETCILDHGAGFGVDVVGLHARPDRGDSALLSRQDRSIDRLERARDHTCDENSRQVTFIRMSSGSPVDQDKIVLADPRLSTSVERGARPSGHRPRRSAESSLRWHRSAANSLPAASATSFSLSPGRSPARSIVKARSA